MLSVDIKGAKFKTMYQIKTTINCGTATEAKEVMDVIGHKAPIMTLEKDGIVIPFGQINREAADEVKVEEVEKVEEFEKVEEKLEEESTTTGNVQEDQDQSSDVEENSGDGEANTESEGQDGEGEKIEGETEGKIASDEVGSAPEGTGVASQEEAKDQAAE